MPIKYVETANTQLSLLGVSDYYQTKNPSKLSCPAKFKATNIWKAMFDNRDFVTHLEQSNDKWNYAISVYLKICHDQGETAFKDEGDRTTNNRISEYLMTARRIVVKYLDSTGILDKYSLRFPERGYVFKDNGFMIINRAVVRNFGDAIQLTDYIKSVGFTRTGDGRFHKVLNSAIRVHFKITNGINAIISYEIKVHSTPYVPLKRLSRIKMNNWVSHYLWLPAVRANRFKTLKNRNSLF